MPDTLPQAIAYLESGYSVIPCGRDKRPVLGAWKLYQTERPKRAIVEGWWKEFPGANVAIITGAISDLTVIDVDGAVGMASIRDSGIAAKLPPTRVIKTPHGHHLYFKHNAAFHTGAGFLPGLDVRSDGGYVVAPPSVSEDGSLYEVFRDRPVLPLALTDEHFQAKHRVVAKNETTATPGWVSEALAHGAPEKQRNSTAIRLAGYFHSKNIPDDIVLATLLDFGRRCTPPMDERELETVVRSAARYPTKPETIHIEDAPTLEVLGDTYRFRWAKYNLTVLLEQLHEDKEGVHSEITLLSDADPTRYLYGPIRYNLTASVQRTGITKHLKEFRDLDAEKLLQDISRMTITQLRKGEEPLYLADVEAPDKPEWAIDRLVLAGHPNILFGMGGTSKSYIALAVMLTLQAGRDIGFGFKPSRAMRGLYLDWEFEASDHHQRMTWLVGNDFEMAGLGVMYLRCTGSLYSSISRIRKIIVEQQIDFVVIDSVAIACGGAPETAENALRFFDALRTLKVTSLCIAHSTKVESNGYAFGSIFWHNAARNIWEIIKDQDEGAKSIHVMLKHRKSNVGPLYPSIGIALKFEDDRVKMTLGEADKSTPAFASKLTQREKLIVYLTDNGPSSPTDIIEGIPMTSDNLNHVLDRDRAADKPSFDVIMDGTRRRQIKLATVLDDAK